MASAFLLRFTRTSQHVDDLHVCKTIPAHRLHASLPAYREKNGRRSVPETGTRSRVVLKTDSDEARPHIIVRKEAPDADSNRRSCPTPTWRRLDKTRHRLRRPPWHSEGRATGIAISTAMIAMTTRSSTSVKPFRIHAARAKRTAGVVRSAKCSGIGINSAHPFFASVAFEQTLFRFVTPSGKSQNQIHDQG